VPISQDVPTNSVSELRELSGPIAPRRGVVVPYDFRRPSKLSREHIRVLQMAYETFARRLTTLLTSGLRQLCQVAIADISQQSYEEYVTGLEPQTLLAPIALPQLSGTGVLQFSLPAALTSIDHMLGGPGGRQPPRPLTDIETTLMRGLLEQMVGVLRYALEPVVPLTPTLGPIEYNPQFLQAAGATDAVVVGSFDMLVGAERCRLSLCLPLAPLLPKLMARPRDDGDDARLVAQDTARRLRARLGDVPVDVTVRFRSVELSPSRILSLSEGDVLALTHRVGVPLDVQAGGVTFAQAIAGKAGSRLAALVVQTPQEHA
jgi:flagellar motor switch protein FliM